MDNTDGKSVQTTAMFSFQRKAIIDVAKDTLPNVSSQMRFTARLELEQHGLWPSKKDYASAIVDAFEEDLCIALEQTLTESLARLARQIIQSEFDSLDQEEKGAFAELREKFRSRKTHLAECAKAIGVPLAEGENQDSSQEHSPHEKYPRCGHSL